jgi:beta-barrel assembly-enhancing protease
MLNRFFRTRRWVYSLVSFLLVLVISFGPTTIARAIDWAEIIKRGGELIQLTNISEAQETDIGKQLNDRIAKEMKLSSSSALAKYVNEIGQKIVAQGDRPNLKYTFQVVDDDGVNAFATMGGYVYVNKGLLKIADNEAQLASVIGHEAGHITGKHALKRLQSAAKAQLGLSVLGVKTNVLVDIGYELLLNRPNGRQAEFDADVRGLKMLSKAGYAQPEMANFMRKLITDGAKVPTLLSTHPDTRDRVAALEDQIKRNPTTGTAGTDAVAYAQRVSKTVTKPVATPSPSPTPTPAASPTPLPSPSPTPLPSPSPTVSPMPLPSPKSNSGSLVVPTE